MRKNKRASRIKDFEKKVLCSSLALLMGSMVISPEFVSHIYAENLIIHSNFEEILAENKLSASIRLYLEEKEGQKIKNITMPDGAVVEKEAFQKHENGKYFFDYKAEENKKLEYEVAYTETTAENGETSAAESEVKKEKLTYDVTNLKTLDQLHLDIAAEDITYAAGDKVDFRKGITVKNEDGEDISKSLNFNVLDYGGFKENTAGTYSIKYEVKHPVSNEDYEFTRKITVKSKEITDKSRIASSKNTNTSTGGIELASSNSSLKNPTDFNLRDNTQNEFNVSVVYDSKSIDTKRSAKIYIPRGYSLARNITTNEITTASDIETTGNLEDGYVVNVKFKDGITINAGFDLRIKRNVGYLYDLASKDAVDSIFGIDVLEDETTIREHKEFSFHMDKLKSQKEAGAFIVDFEPKPTIDTYSGRVQYKLSITKKAMVSSLDEDIYLRIPKKVGEIESERVSQVVEGYGEFIHHDIVTETDDEIIMHISNPKMHEAFRHSLNDRKITYTLVYKESKKKNPWDTRLYGKNPNIGTSENNLILMNANGEVKDFGKLTGNTNDLTPSLSKIDYFQLGQVKVTGDKAFRYHGTEEDIYIYRSAPSSYARVKTTYEFPYEIQPIKISAMSKVVITTNQNNTFEIFDKENFDFKKLNSNEFITKVDAYSTSSNITGGVDGSALAMKVRYSNIDIDGKELPRNQYVKLKSTVSSIDTSNTETKEIQIAVWPQIDSFGFDNKKNNENPNRKVVLNSGFETSISKLHYTIITQNITYKNARLDFSGEDFLSLVKKIKTSDRKNSKYKVEYDTNLAANQSKSGQSIIDLGLKEGEYVTKLSIVFDELVSDSSQNISEGIEFIGNDIPNKTIPTDFDLKDKYLTYEVRFSSDNGKSNPTIIGKSYTFIEGNDPSFNFSSQYTEKYPYPYTTTYMLRLSISKGDQQKNLRNTIIDVSETDPLVLSFIDRVSLTGVGNEFLNDTTIVYTTNYRKDPVEKKYYDISKLNDREDEYVTSLKIKIPKLNIPKESLFAPEVVFEYDFTKGPRRTSRIDGKYLGDKSLGYPAKVKIAADNMSEITEETPVYISGKYEAEYEFVNTSKAYAEFTNVNLYQGEKTKVNINMFDFRMRPIVEPIRDKNPIYYVEVDDRFSVDLNSALVYIDNSEVLADATLLNKKTKDGNKIVKFTVHNWDKIIRSGTTITSPKISIDLLTNPSMTGNNVIPIKRIWTDFTNGGIDDDLKYGTIKNGDKYDTAESGITDETNGITEDGTVMYYKNIDNKISILPAVELGISNYAVKNENYTDEVVGHDNDTFEQMLAITSHLNKSTKDWIVYIPVPKKGRTIQYVKSVNGKEEIIQSDPSEFSLNLTKEVDASNLPAGATIEYSLDENPSYSLDGSSVGTYTDTVSDWTKVTMVKIKIPELSAKEKVYPKLTYKVTNDKTEIGDQKAYTTSFFNYKMEDSPDYVYKEGTNASVLTYKLIDFIVSGSVWQDTEMPYNSIKNSYDLFKAGVEVVGKDKNGNDFITKTKADGNYSLAIPTHGIANIEVKLPNNLSAVPKQEYNFVEKGKGTAISSSYVDQATGLASVVFKNDDIQNINAGIYPERAVKVTGGNVTVGLGKQINVPAVAFPSDSVITYESPTDTAIATVDANGVVTGVALGTTTAKVSIPDGKGGVAEDTYTIRVVKVQPTAEFEDITIFEGDSYDANAGIKIFDSDKNSIDVNDKSKVEVNTSAVNTAVPGKYPITYTVKEGSDETTFTRNIYVHGKIKIIAPTDKTVKVNESVKAAEGATASYVHIDEQGNPKQISVQVTTPNDTITSSEVKKVEVPLTAEVTVNGASNKANASYHVSFHEIAVINTVKDNITIKAGTEIDDIKKMIGATAEMKTVDSTVDLTHTINWDILNGFDIHIEGNTITGNIYVIDPENNKKIEKEITITVTKKPIISAPDKLILVEGDSYSSKDGVTIIDGNGNDVALTDDMITSTVPLDKDGKATTFGNYMTTYTYTDSYGNKVSRTTTVEVNGVVEIDVPDRKDMVVDTVYDQDAELTKAKYKDNNGQYQSVPMSYDKKVDTKTVGLTEITYKAEHPISHSESTKKMKVYVHGKPKITVPAERRVKVDTDITTADGVSAVYEFVEDDGNVKEKPADRIEFAKDGNSYTDATFTSRSPGVVIIEVTASAVFNTKEENFDYSERKTYEVIFSGYPIIDVKNPIITVRVNETADEIKKMLNASASVHYGDQTAPTDLTSSIDWSEVNNMDTSTADTEKTVKIYVTDKDGEKAEKEVTVKISKDIVANLPVVNKVVKETFDPKENVTIFDGNGNLVDMNKVTIDTSKVDMTEPGNYEVTYSYKDDLGNELNVTNTVHVHGEMQFELDRVDLIREDGKEYIPTGGKAYYIDSNRKTQYVGGMYKGKVDQSKIGLKSAEFTAVHPINQAIVSANQNVYVHGELILKAPMDMVVKVNTLINPVQGATATYTFVDDKGIEIEKTAIVTSSISNPYTSSSPEVKDIPLSSSAEIVSGLTTSASGSYNVIFNGMPKITVSNSELTVKVGASIDDIKNAFNATAAVQYGDEATITDLTPYINWSEVDVIDTSKEGETYKVAISVVDRDGSIAEKELTIHVSKKGSINVPVVNHVVNETFNPVKDVTVFDGNGNQVDVNTLTIDTSNVDMSTPGNYEVTYKFTDSLGNETVQTNTVHVHGKLDFENLDRDDIVREDGKMYTPVGGNAFYVNSDGVKIVVSGSFDRDVDQSIVGLNEVTYKAVHPVNGQEATNIKNVYVHGEVKITAPSDKTVKVNTEINTVEGAKASYKFVKDDGTVMDEEVPVTSALGDTHTSSVPSVEQIPLNAKAEIVPGLTTSATGNYQVTFNGMPEITVMNPEITVKVGATADEIKKILDAHASVQYGKENGPTDLTPSIDWKEVEQLDTTKESEVYKVKIYVTDDDGAKAEKEITINISKKGTINVPVVDKVEGEKFDPKENVTIVDGNGNIVDIDKVIIDDSKVDTSKPGNYEVTYEYKDEHGNKITETNTVHVHGKLKFEDLGRDDVIREDGATYVPTGGKAYYINSDGIPVEVAGSFTGTIDQSVIGRKEAEYKAIHPINKEEVKGNKKVYVHGEIVITPASDKTVKVNTEINPTDGASANYKFIEDNGKIIDKAVDVKSSLSDPYTSTTPGVKDIPLSAETEVVKGLTSTASASYKVTFNGMPEIKVANPNITVKIGITTTEIKDILKASASVLYGEDGNSYTDLTADIDWKEVDAIDTTKESASYKVKIYVTDRDGATAEKELTITVSKKGSINVPIVNKVEGEAFDPKENVTIVDGDGNNVNINDVTINDSKVDTSKPGNYEVTYEYEDKHGNKITQTNTVHVHGKLDFENLDRDDIVREDGKMYTPVGGNAFYVNSDGVKIVVSGSFDRDIDQSVVGLNEVTYKAIHPVNSQEATNIKNVYVHGEVKITAPSDKTVKVNTEINTVEGAKASYKFVKDDGTVTDEEVPVTSALGDTYTSLVPSVEQIPLNAKAEIVPGLMTSATGNYQVTFNGMPEITVMNPEITVKVGATADEIKKILDAHASVQYGKENGPTDLTPSIDWKEVEQLDTTKESEVYKVKIYVTDDDGAKAEKEITIKISKKGTINVPVVDKVEGEKFDPKENVTIVDGNGNLVDIDKVIIDDSKVDTSKPGNYEVTYEYKDEHGNKITETNTVHVHGKLKFEDLGRDDVIREDGATYVPTGGKAYYINSDGIPVEVAGSFTGTIDQSVIGRKEAEYKAIHPINKEEVKGNKKVYVHGEIVITPASDKTVKVNTEINPTDGASAMYKFIEDNGTIIDKAVDVKSSLSDPYTSTTPGVKDIPLSAETEVMKGLTSTASASYKVTFNGMPEIKVANPNITVKIGITTTEIKDILKASASVLYGEDGNSYTDLTADIDWKEVDAIDTTKESASYKVKIYVTDRDGTTAEKELTITVSKKGSINVPIVNKVEGETFDPKENVTIADGNGNSVDIDKVIIDDSKVDTSKPGNYEVTYEYEDELGNKITETNTVHVHGKLQFEDLDRDDVIRKDGTTYVPSGGKAYYINSNGVNTHVNGAFDGTVDQSIVARNEVTYKAVHPVNNQEAIGIKNVYVHGEVKITAPSNKTVKVNTEINTVEGAKASYKLVKDDGIVTDEEVSVTSALGDTYTSSEPSVQQVPLNAKAEIVPGLTTSATGNYQVTFNGMPEITVMNPEITVKVGATADEIKKILDAHASVQYGKENSPTDLTPSIDWKEVEQLDTAKESEVYKVKIYVTDDDGAKAEKEITIKISKKGTINVPVVDKVEGEKFDPKENVTIVDGNGNLVDIDKVIIDDSKVDTSKPGNYEVTYEYEDEHGNKITETNTVHVHGKLVIEGLDRIDLEREDGKTYVPDSGKAYYVNSDGEKIYIDGSYDKVVDQSKTGLTETEFSATHPVNKEKESGKQNIYVHGEIVFHKPDQITDKVGESVNVSKDVTATFDKVNDDGTITTTELPVTSPKDVTSDKAGKVDGDVEASVKVNGIEISGQDKVTVSFDGYPYIDSVSHISADAGSVTTADIKNMIDAFAGMEQADGTTVDLTDKIKYTFLDDVNVKKQGTYHVILTVKDDVGYTASKIVVVDIYEKAIVNPPINPEIPVKPINPEKPVTPVDPVNPINPVTPVDPVSPLTPDKPESPSDSSDKGENKKNDNKDDKKDNKENISYVIITKDIPLDIAKDGISEELLEAYITAKSDRNGNESFEIVSHTVKPELGEYQVTLRFADGTEKIVSINVIDDKAKGLEKPAFGHDEDCIIHWIILLLLLGYSVYAIMAMLKRRRDIKKLEEELESLNEVLRKEE